MTSDEPLAPSWAKFPDYTRYTIGWRMGAGEDYKYKWWDSLKTLPTDMESRLAYLRKHPRAPYSWADHVNSILFPDQQEAHLPLSGLLELGLLQSDVAYHTWLAQRDGLGVPWRREGQTPASLARYSTRPFWFWGRQVASLREQDLLTIPALPEAWQPLRPLLLTGQLDSVDPSQGLLTLAKMICAGRVQAPWSLRLQPDAEDNYKEDMNYTSAFALWASDAFDDLPHLQGVLARDPPPEAWSDWVQEKLLRRWSQDEQSLNSL